MRRSRVRLLLVLGVSGVGKTTIIEKLMSFDARFRYVSPFMTRPLREGETHKTYLPEAEFDARLRAGEFLVVNELFGVKYGTPAASIDLAFANQEFPVIDWPVQLVSIMEAAYPERICAVYVEPPSLETLRMRQGDRALQGNRWEAAIAELKNLKAGMFDQKISLRLASADGHPDQAARHIYSHYLSQVKE